MAKLPRQLEANEDTGTPRWVKVLGITFIALIVVVVILHLTGNDFHSLHGLIRPAHDLAIAAQEGVGRV